MAEIHRQVYENGGPAIYFEKIKGSPFPAVSNLYGTWERTQFLFRKTLPDVRDVTQVKINPEGILKQPWKAPGLGLKALKALPLKTSWLKSTYAETTIDQLPGVISWPDDAGRFVTLPQVMTLPPHSKNIMQSNIGMYRIQLNGNDYENNQEIGLHYQLHRGIGVHHKQYLASDEPFRVSIFIGGPPSHAVAAIMPLPEGLSEVTFMGLLGGRRFRYGWKDGYVVSGDADFVITGEVDKEHLKMEGPFGDHLGYYSLGHLFPFMRVHKVWHRKDAIWHFTVVGRPPQEDSNFGRLIHEIVDEVTPVEFPGLIDLNAVDAAGVHPLLLAIGKERYMPFRDRKPEELLTIANHLLGKGQTSLAKFLFICDRADQEHMRAKDIEAMFKYILERFQPERDLHFYTNWTIDTLDYSGGDWNSGSKLVWAAAGPKLRTLAIDIPTEFRTIISSKISNPLPGILAIQIKPYEDHKKADLEIGELIILLQQLDLSSWPLIVLCDDADFICESLNNFLWVTFTRANPASDMYGVGAFTKNKHWGCTGAVIIDSRIKPHHAPPLLIDETIQQNVTEILNTYSYERNEE
jgi:4-hydroxy-3-polyprenylbenzoate decarboxylase